MYIEVGVFFSTAVNRISKPAFLLSKYRVLCCDCPTSAFDGVCPDVHLGSPSKAVIVYRCYL